MVTHVTRPYTMPRGRGMSSRFFEGGRAGWSWMEGSLGTVPDGVES